MSMDELADQVGIAKATLYQHFATKEDLAAAVILRDMDRFVARLDDPAAAARRPIDRIADALAWVLDMRHAKDEPEFTAGSEEFFRLFHNRSDFRAGQHRCWESLSRLVDEAKAAGQVKAGLPTPVIAALFFSIAVGHLFGLIVRERLVGRQDLSDALRTIFFEGIAAVPVAAEPAAATI
jgi:TetR/AcrR family transcriptional regulator of autoinduction and epiphytic fitness